MEALKNNLGHAFPYYDSVLITYVYEYGITLFIAAMKWTFIRNYY
jgi:hypothetical protein